MLECPPVPLRALVPHHLRVYSGLPCEHLSPCWWSPSEPAPVDGLERACRCLEQPSVAPLGI